MEKIFSDRRYLQKMNERIQFYYYETCIFSFFGGNRSHQKDISRSTDLLVSIKKTTEQENSPKQ